MQHKKTFIVTLTCLLLMIHSAAFAQDITPRAIGAPVATASSKFKPVNANAPVSNAALFVGVNEFTYDDGLRALDFAVNDAVAQAYLFVVQLKLVPPQNCFLSLSGQPSTQQTSEQLAGLKQAGVKVVPATRTAILRHLLLVEKIPQTSADLLIVSISSHGFEGGGTPYAMPSDGLRNLLEDTAVNITTVENRLARSKAGKRLLLLDACRERPSALGKGGDQPMTRAFRSALATAAGQAVLASCDAGQISYENPELGHGVFTYYLLKGLHGEAAADGRGFITLGSVSDYLASAVNDWAVRTQPELSRDQVQRPWFKGPKDAEDIPLAIDPGIHEKRAALKSETAKVIDRLKMKINYRGSFNPEMYAQLAEALEKAGNDPADTAGQDLLANARDFADGKIRESMFVAYLNTALGRQVYVHPQPARPSPPVVPTAVEMPSKMGQTFINSIGMKLTYIPAGEFMMGSPEDEEDRSGYSETQHHVTLSKPYLLGVKEVTKGQFSQFIEETGYQTTAEREGWAYRKEKHQVEKIFGASWRFPGYEQADNHPVVCVSWNDAVAFCQWLSRKEGRQYRLPTEAEWEYACRAGSTTPFNTGNSISTDQANYKGSWLYESERKTADREKAIAVGSFRPNKWGLYDMHGNVWEWCSDWKKSFSHDPVTDPTGPQSGDKRVARGGSWADRQKSCRSANRGQNVPDGRHNISGFRVVLEF